MLLPACHSAKRTDSHEDLENLEDGVYGWAGHSNWLFAGIDAVVQPDTMYHIAVSEKHGINTRGLATAASYLRGGVKNARLLFAVLPDAFFFSQSAARQKLKTIQGRPDLKTLAESVRQYMLQIPTEACLAAKDASNMKP